MVAWCCGSRFIPGRVALCAWVALAGTVGTVVTLIATGTPPHLAPGLALLLALPAVVVLLDLDHFKKINDRFGHAAGDEVLRQVARLCLQCFRSIDSIGRLGDEEFAVLLPGASLDGAAAVAQRLAQQLVATPVVFGAHTIPLSATMGVAERLPAEKTLGLQRADQGLYAGKQAGRGRVMVVRPDGQIGQHGVAASAPAVAPALVPASGTSGAQAL